MKTINVTFFLASFICLTNAAEAADRTLTFGVIAKSNNNPVFQVVRVSAEAEARKLTAEKGVQVKIDWRTPTEEDPQKQAEVIEQLVNIGASGIAVSCSDANKLTPAIDEAVARGVPVVTFDSDAPASKRFAFVGVDEVECGRDLCRAIAKELNNTGVVAVLAGNPNAPNLQRRIVGLREEAANYPNLKILDTFYHKETPQDSLATVEQVMQAHPEDGFKARATEDCGSKKSLQKFGDRCVKVFKISGLAQGFWSNRDKLGTRNQLRNSSGV